MSDAVEHYNDDDAVFFSYGPRYYGSFDDEEEKFVGQEDLPPVNHSRGAIQNGHEIVFHGCGIEGEEYSSTSLQHRQ